MNYLKFDINKILSKHGYDIEFINTHEALFLELKELVEQPILEELGLIHSSQTKYQNIVDHIQKLVFQTDSSYNVMFLNKDWQKELSIDPNELMGQSILNLFDNESKERFLIPFVEDQKANETQFVAKFNESWLGIDAWYYVSLKKTMHEDGCFSGVIGSIMNFSSFKLKESEMEENQRTLRQQQQVIRHQMNELNHKNSELRKFIQSNLQLENFAYIASHDLKAPLRSVLSFSQLLHKNYRNCLDEKGNSFVNIIVDSAKNMLNKIDSLLEYSKITTEEVNLEKFNVKDVVKQIMPYLSTYLNKSDSSFQCNVGDLLITADEFKFYQLLQNLVINATKFRKDDTKNTIELSVTDHEMEWEFSVTDNGIGIEEQYHNEIFDMFKKLHSNDTYKGNGLGLSICKTIVEQHQGRIWVHSKLGEGSTFCFTIPKYPQPKEVEQPMSSIEN